MTPPLSIFIGWDSRESVCSYVVAHSLTKRSSAPLKIEHLKHRELRSKGLFSRPWIVNGAKGETTDLIDGKTFSTEFSHTRFLVPHLMNYQGWALFLDCDMLALCDIAKLFVLRDDKYAVMCVKHIYPMQGNGVKMDSCTQTIYRRKNWSSFMLWNCAHPANRKLTPAQVNFMNGGDLHALTWLNDTQIGELPFTYNYISGVSPKLPPERGGMPDMIHYTEGGPWFAECRDVPYGDRWTECYEDWQRNGAQREMPTDVPSVRYE